MTISNMNAIQLGKTAGRMARNVLGVSKISGTVRGYSSFDFDGYKPGHSFLPKMENNPDEPIVFLHDFLSNKNDYATEANDIASTLETDVYVPNYRAGVSEITSESLVDDLAEFCKQSGFDKVILIGEGLGGRVSMLAALQGKVDVSKLVVVENYPMRLPDLKIKQLATWIDSLLYLTEDADIPKSDKNYLGKANEILLEKFNVDSSYARNYLLSNITNRGSGRFLETKVPLQAYRDYLKDYQQWDSRQEKFENPALFLYGRHSLLMNQDIYKSMDLNREIAKYFPENKKKTFSSDEFLVKRQSTKFVNAVSQFLIKEYRGNYQDSIDKE